MTKIPKVLTEHLRQLPHKLLEQRISEKMKDAGVPAHNDAAAKLVAHLRDGNRSPFQWRDDTDGPDREIAIEITEEDFKAVEQDYNAFLKDRLPVAIRSAIEEAAKQLHASLKKKWPEVSDWEQANFARFRYNLEVRWGKALDLLRFFLSMCREAGEERHKRYRRSKKRGAAMGVLIRLHIRACQVTDEIITLLENGFADGAIARWRTLYEIGIVATVISDFGDDIAERYIAHEVVEAKAGMDEYERCHVPLGEPPMSKRERKHAAQAHARAIAKYGNAFKGPYGWAAHHLKSAKPTFSDLEKAAGRSPMRIHYKAASYNVHASPKGMFFKLGIMKGPTTAIAGASNAGLADPGIRAAETLSQITGLLKGDAPSFGEMLKLRVLVICREEIARAFVRADRKLIRDEVRRQKEVVGKKAKGKG